MGPARPVAAPRTLLARATLLLVTACATVPPPTAVAPAAAARSGAADSASGAMSQRVRQAFLHAWDGYRRYAWGHDDLNPISQSPHDWYGVSLLMTPVDAYDTMLLMGLDPEAADAKRLILERLSFDRDISVQVFEVTIRMWTTFDVEPETIDYSRMAIVSPEYQLRPESLESAYYLYTLTHDPRYRDAGRAMFEAIERWTGTDAGFASLADVRTKEKQDRMHSFMLAETLKYAFLLLAPPGTLDLDQVIFNTEAHPLKRVR